MVRKLNDIRMPLREFLGRLDQFHSEFIMIDPEDFRLFNEFFDNYMMVDYRTYKQSGRSLNKSWHDVIHDLRNSPLPERYFLVE